MTLRKHKEFPVSHNKLGCGGGICDIWYELDITEMCHEMLESQQFALYLTFKDSCDDWTSICWNNIYFLGVGYDDEDKHPKMEWKFSIPIFYNKSYF